MHEKVDPPALPTGDGDRVRFLADAGLALVSSLDYAAALQQVAQLAIGSFCDYCIFDVFDEDGRSRRVAWAHCNPNFPRFREIGNFAPPTHVENYPVAEMIRTGRPVFVPIIDEAWMKSITWSKEHLDLMRELNASSAMWIPLSAHGTTLGSAIFAHSESRRHFTDVDLSLGIELGRRIGLAVLHARQYEELQASASRLKEMTRHQRTLIHELNHRVKNTLAIVRAMASQTIRGATPEVAEGLLSGRLMALAEAHDLLTQDNWNGATASDIVAAIVRTHDTSGRARFHVDGQPVRLKPHLALSLTMTLHELATNAIKYGALSNDTGSVDVSWGVEDGEEPLFRFAWRERGGPPVREPRVVDSALA